MWSWPSCGHFPSCQIGLRAAWPTHPTSHLSSGDTCTSSLEGQVSAGHSRRRSSKVCDDTLSHFAETTLPQCPEKEHYGSSDSRRPYVLCAGQKSFFQRAETLVAAAKWEGGRLTPSHFAALPMSQPPTCSKVLSFATRVILRLVELQQSKQEQLSGLQFLLKSIDLGVLADCLQPHARTPRSPEATALTGTPEISTVSCHGISA